MGLFSFLRKNKQESTGQDSGYYSGPDEQAWTARARAKRASNADGPAPRRAGKEAADPILPEKKRARRRLVGAVALALGVAVGLPMLLDSEPKPLASDIAIQIPSQEQPRPATASARVAGSSSVAASAALDQSEEIVTVPAKPALAAPAPAVIADVKPVPAAKAPASPLAEPLKIEKTLPRIEAKHVPKIVDVKPVVKPLVKPVHKAEEKAIAETPKPVRKVEEKVVAEAPKAQANDTERALDILEGKPAAKASAAAPQKFVVQVAALATQDKVDELQAKLKESGINSYVQKIQTAAGQRIRVRVGPFGSKEEAEKARAKLSRIGLNGSLVPA